MRKRKGNPINSVMADPALWSEQSQGSVASHFTKEYKDIKYKCWRCNTNAVFSAQDQKYTYEERKAPIDQKRILCPDCWKISIEIAAQLDERDQQWSGQKDLLKKDIAFLSSWLNLLEAREQYVPYKANTAIKNMLKKFINRNA